MKYFFFLISLFPFYLFAQIDREFWFAPPEVSSYHADRPIYLRISSLNKSVNFTISQPANPAFIPIIKTLAANTTLSIDLTPYIDILETKPENTVLNTGLYIESDYEITVYYEVVGSSQYGVGVNSDIFTLKGNNALGLDFFIPFQTYWDNNPTQNAWASFDIVATENNTLVTITPTQNLAGHPAGIPYTITLHKGQTYSARAASTLAYLRPSGTRVTSTKPIAITMKDDSILEQTNYDLAGDQLLPVEKIGTEYIAPRISLSGVFDRLFICATQNNTQLFVNGSSTPYAILNAGQTLHLPFSTSTCHIITSAPVYVHHVGGYGPELAGALLPPLGCSGSRQISFTRSVSENFSIYILVKSGFESGFTINDNAYILAASMFLDVVGSGGQWKYAFFNLSESIIPVGSNNIIRHPNADFHLAIVNGVAYPTGFRYGYFSDYGFLELGHPKGVCVNDSIRIDAGFGKSSYTWNTGSNHQYIYVKNPGIYKVTVTKGSCTFTDSIQVYQHPEITTPILQDSVQACANETLIIKTIVPYKQYLWYTGSKWPADTPRYSGNHWVEITNDVGCKKKDTIHVLIHPLPQPKIIYNTDLESFCKDSLVVLDAGPGFYSYLWHTGETTQTIITTHNSEDFYKVTVSGEGGCINSDSISLDCSVIIGTLPNLITANNDGKNDVFYVQYLRYGTWTFEVINKWGQRVYFNKLYDNSWKPENLSEDVYYFSFRHNKSGKELKGWLHIMNPP